MEASSAAPLRGAFLRPLEDRPGWAWLPDGLLTVDEEGRIVTLEAAPEGCEVAEAAPGAVWLPGFVDTHVHFPQTRIVGSASGPLLTWLERSVFPEEGRFASGAYAEAVAEEFCDALLSQGTTCASIFSSSHPVAAEALFAAMARRGLRGDVGLTLMDRGAPPEVLLALEPAMAACEALVARWHGADRDRLRFRVTPRFALSCTPALLEAAGALAARHGLPIQTHISENLAEIEATAAAFPEAEDYLAVYEAAGLVTEQSLFAHCIWLGGREWDALAAARASISHCPDSNFFLGSGVMPLDEARRRQIKLGLGSDVGAGRSFSMRRACSRGYDASRLSGAQVDAAELLWLATRGGAVAMGRGDQIGLLAPGFDADLVALRPPRHAASLEALFEALAFCEDHPAVVEVRVRGHRLR
jgi:guanine deaminase